MKRNSLLIILFIVGIVLITYFNFKIYSATYNEKMLNIIHQIIEENPNINIDSIIDAFDNSNEVNLDILNEYGYEKEDLYLTDDIKNKVNAVLIINVITALCLVFVLIKLSVSKNKKRKKEIEELINYLERINNGDYNIDLERYAEGEFSRLRDQIYKTTVLLKENETNLLIDKTNLKNNLADISHQLKTPLTSIMLMLENINYDEKMNFKKRKEYINKISDQADKMKYLIEILLKVARFDACVVNFNKENIKLNKIINKAILNLDYLIKEKNVNLNIDLKSNSFINCDKKWQEEAITNILKNSIENSFEKGVIDIVIKENNFYTSLIIKDYGKGISKDLQKCIFERFKKNENSNGIGIGLNLAKMIIEQDNGIIVLTSVLHEYTCFEIKYMK